MNADATGTAGEGTLTDVSDIIEQTAADHIAVDLASHACAYGDPTEPEHDHGACLDAPGAALAEHLFHIARAAAEDRWKDARLALRRLDQAIGAGEFR